MDESFDGELHEGVDPVPAYRVDDSISFLVKCTDDSLPDDWYDLHLEDWIEAGNWYKVMGIIGSKSLSQADFIVWDMKRKYLVHPSESIFTFPSSMFDLKETLLLSNN